MSLPTALDGARRRRIYLFRHGAVDYVDRDGRVVPDPDAVRLNGTGRAQTRAMAGHFREVPVDRAVCSGLRRTRETASRVLEGRGIEIGEAPGLREIRPGEGVIADGLDLVKDVAYGHWRAADPERRYLGGESYREFYERVTAALEALIAEPGWTRLGIFAHGGTNAGLIGWVLGLGVRAFGVVDQATCCLNVIDLDVDAGSGEVVRKTLRAMNVTAYDPLKSERHYGDMEALARFFLPREERTELR